jgi:hypothetical protein
MKQLLVTFAAILFLLSLATSVNAMGDEDIELEIIDETTTTDYLPEQKNYVRMTTEDSDDQWDGVLP